VTKALPLVKNRPARAGKKAKAKGELCQWDRSSGAVESSWSRPREGRIKSPAECRVSSKLEKESSEERRREKEGSNGGAPSAAGWLVFADERLRSVKEGGRGRADDDAPATGVCEASSGEGGADVLKDGLVMVPVVKDWGKRGQVHVIVLVRLAIVTALHELRVPSFSTGNRQSSWLPFWRAPNPPLRLASAGTPARDDRCGDRLPPFFPRSRRVRRHALLLLSCRTQSSFSIRETIVFRLHAVTVQSCAVGQSAVH
jgi:hypothetical protein